MLRGYFARDTKYGFCEARSNERTSRYMWEVLSFVRQRRWRREFTLLYMRVESGLAIEEK